MDRIDLLEAKVKEMIGMVHSLRQENSRLRTELDETRAIKSGLDETRQLLDEERDTVRSRIEQLLGELEGLTEPEAAAPPAAESLQTEAGAAHAATESRENPVLPGFS
jgi:uncharacterized coiled-coil DUF342 family protein